MPDMDDEPRASFSGRLNIADFAFAESPRRSPRLSCRDPTATPSPPKRRADAELVSPRRRPTAPAPSPLFSAGGADPARRKPPSPRKRAPSGYAPPSTYAHLSPLTDRLGPDLLVLLVGLNPGVTTARTGHAYAHPSNLFWKLLFSSGMTTRLVAPEENSRMPAEYALGLTNIVARPSRNGSELSKAEMDEGVAVLEGKVREYRPEVVCFVGKSIWESVWRVGRGRGIRKEEFKYGWQDEGEVFAPVCGGEEGEGAAGGGWAGAKIFVASSTSGLAATLSPAEKQKIWRELGVYVERRRAERAGVVGQTPSPGAGDRKTPETPIKLEGLGSTE